MLRSVRPAVNEDRRGKESELMSPATHTTATGAPEIHGLVLLKRIGEGGEGVVYRAIHQTLQRVVAVKILWGRAESEAACPAWLRESRLTAALAHPHVIAVHDAGQADGRGYLVMEYVAGGSLRARMEPGVPWDLGRVDSYGCFKTTRMAANCTNAR
jgi:serine/threonine protein kinase